MKKEILAIVIIFVLMAVGFSGCLNESTVTTLANQMEEKYNSISDYKATISYSSYTDYEREYSKTIKKPNKLKYEYITPDYKTGDLRIVNGDTMWDYDASKNVAYENKHDIDIGGESLETPDFLNMLLFLMDNFEVVQLDDEVVGEFTAYVLEMTPDFQTTFSKLKFWIDKDTLFPIKWERYDTNGEVSYTELVESFEIDAGVEDSEFELPEDAEILTLIDWNNPTTIGECEDLVGFSILFPTYVPEGYSVDEEYTVGSDGIRISGDGSYEIAYFQNNVMRQVVDYIDTVCITYPHNDSYAEFIDLTTGEILMTVYNTTGEFPSEWYGNVELETYTHDITLYEALEDVFGDGYLPKHNATTVDINGIQGEYWIDKDTGQYGEVVYERACLSWSLNEYWLMLTAGGDAFLDSDEMVNIAESINTQ